MQIRVGYDLIYNCPQGTPMILIVNIHYSRASDIVIPDYLTTVPAVPITASVGFGSGSEPTALIGIGDREAVDVTVVMPNDGERVEIAGVGAGERIVLDATACP